MPTPFFSETFLRPADAIRYNATLSGAAYAAADAAVSTSDRAFRLSLQRDTLIYLGTAAPANDAASVLTRGGQFHAFLPAGQRVWLKRAGTANGYGSIELWTINA